MNHDDYVVEAAAVNGRPQRLVSIDRTDGVGFRDHINSDSAVSRQRFVGRAAQKFGVGPNHFDWLDDAIVSAADAADANADALVGATPADGRKSQATLLVEIGSNADLFHDADLDAFARFEVNGRFEVAGVRTKHFRRWLARIFYLTEGKAPSSQSMQNAIGVLEGKALYEGALRQTSVRLAGHDGKIYVDLCNEVWQVIEISSLGWNILDESPVMFRRAKAMLPIPAPVRGGSSDELRGFLNIGDDDWILLSAWVVASLSPTGPYPVLDIQGEHGSGKSTVCRLVRSLIDPNTAMLRSEPREPRDLMIASKNGWILALDNLSGIQAWQSDCLCRLSTGGGFSTRTLYENDEETIFDAQRPVIINGIEEVATRADLLDRCLLLNLPRIEQTARRPESELWAAFEEARPRILGVLFTAVASALRALPSTKLTQLPRMADFALWATAAEAGLGLRPGQFLSAYAANRDAGNEMALDASPVGKALVGWVDQVGEWCGTASELLKELARKTDESVKNSKAWPQTARGLSGIVRRIAPNLRQTGIEVEFGNEGRARQRRRVIRLARIDTESIDPTDPSVRATENQASCGDGGDEALSRGDDMETQIPFNVTPYATTTGTNGDDGDEESREDPRQVPHSTTLHGLCTGSLDSRNGE